MTRREEAKPGPALRVLIAGGGTGGHLYPGIAVARELKSRRPESEITFVGTRQGIEARIVPREGFALTFIRSAALRGQSLAGLACGVALVPLSLIDAWRVVRRVDPRLVIGVGGYSAGPVVLVAAATGIPTMVLEQNAIPGLTNRLLARVVNAAAVTYEESVPYFRGRAFVAGNPVRPAFQKIEPRPRTTPGARLRLLVFGGSQGAHAINLAMVDAAARLAVAADRLSITHQTGERDRDLVVRAYEAAGLGARVEAFLFEMDREMAEADLLTCRAGATTLAELTVAGRAAILVPFPFAADDHQRKNADVLAHAGAAEVIDERDLTGERLAAAILALLDDPGRRQARAAAALRMGRPQAAALIVDRALALVASAGS